MHFVIVIQIYVCYVVLLKIPIETVVNSVKKLKQWVGV